MYLNLQGLGRLETARIDLGKSLLIFVGRNNTSKTYAAHTIYAVHRFGATYLAESVHALVREQKLEHKLPQPSEVWHHELSIVDLLMPQVPRFIQGLGEHLRTQLPKVFATDDQFFSTTRVELQLGPNEEASIHERLLAQNLGYSFGVEDWQVSVRKPAGSDTLSIDCQPVKPSENGALQGALLVDAGRHRHARNQSPAAGTATGLHRSVHSVDRAQRDPAVQPRAIRQPKPRRRRHLRRCRGFLVSD